VELDNRKREIIAGILFFVATLSYSIGDSLIANDLILGSFLQFLNIFSVIFIAVLLFPILKNIDIKSAKIYLISRSLEGLFLSFSVIGMLFFSKDIYDFFFQIAMFSLTIGSLILLYKLYLKKSLNLIFIIIGVLGYLGLGIWSLLELFSFSSTMLLFAPGAIFEIIFPLFLMFKGFKK
jgi:hypothetical protein